MDGSLVASYSNQTHGRSVQQLAARAAREQQVPQELVMIRQKLTVGLIASAFTLSFAPVWAGQAGSRSSNGDTVGSAVPRDSGGSSSSSGSSGGSTTSGSSS